MRRARHLIALVVLASLCIVGYAVWPGGGGGGGMLHGRSLRAVDGDTLVVRLDGGGVERVRLIGVDTPEDVAPGRPVECWSRRAAAFTARAVRGRRLTLRVGAEQRDRYGRLLAYVRVEATGLDLEEALLRGGYARPLAIPPNTDRAGRYARLAAAARDAGRGLWGACARPFGGS